MLLLVLLALMPIPRVDVDVFNLLPRNSSQVDGLRTYQQHFGGQDELVVLLQAADAESARAAGEALATGLMEAGLARTATWQLALDPRSAGAAELLAYLWVNKPGDDFAALAARLSAEQLMSTLDESVERMATSLQPLEIASLGIDPFGLGDAGAAFELPGGGRDPFASADGRSRVVVLKAADGTSSILDARRWVTSVEAYLDAWSASHEDVETGLTGSPAFAVENGFALVRDLLVAAGGAIVLIALLFWLAHRRWRPLLALVALLVIVLVSAATVGAYVLGSLHAVSLGFAAILMGLAADYALILYQERRSHPDWPERAARNAAAPAILWSAASTAGAFFMLSRSSLPGVTQLGVLVGLGTLIAAVIMLLYYLPLAGSDTRGEAPAPRWARLPMKSASAISILALAIALGAVTLGGVGVDSDSRSLDLGSSSARAVLDTINREIGGFDDDHWLIVEATNDDDVRAALAAGTAALEEARASGVLVDYLSPAEFWPDPTAQLANQPTLASLVKRRAAVVRALDDYGFTDRRLTEAVFAAWGRFAERSVPIWPAQPDAAWLMQRFASRDAGSRAALVRLRPDKAASLESMQALSRNLDEAGAGQLVSWRLLAGSLANVMRGDLERVLLPTGAILLLFMTLAYRRLRDVLLSVAALALSLGLLLGVMAILGWRWNLMNIMALPLLLGAGIDYSLHVQFSMRRNAGDAAAVRNSVGRAILLCAASTASGFASLALASNEGIASLGRVCAVGIVLTSLVAVFLLPAWWRTIHGVSKDDLRIT